MLKLVTARMCYAFFQRPVDGEEELSDVPVCGGLGRRGCGNFDRSMKIIDP
jgi:hypothetical protein